MIFKAAQKMLAYTPHGLGSYVNRGPVSDNTNNCKDVDREHWYYIFCI